MKKLIALVGLLCGMAAALAALALNPLGEQTFTVSATPDAYGWQALEFIGSPLQAADLLGLPTADSEAPVIEEKLRATSAAILLLTDENGQARALATRLSTLADNNDIRFGRVGVDTYTNVFWPNRGSIMMQGYENRWALIRNKLFEMIKQPALGSGVVGFNISADAPREQTLGIAGGSGEFTSTGGRYSEVLVPVPGALGAFQGAVALDIALR